MRFIEKYYENTFMYLKSITKIYEKRKRISDFIISKQSTIIFVSKYDPVFRVKYYNTFMDGFITIIILNLNQ